MTPPSLAPGTTVGHYRVEALIGQGGMGEVYRARDTTLGREVALKVLPTDLVDNAERLARFVHEARSASALNHPHVVTIYEIGEVSVGAGPPGPFIAMELVRGDTLRTLIDQRRLDLKKAIEVLAQVADGLAAAHGAGLVHRDLKPDNLMVTPAGSAKILDFGLAKLRDGSVLDAGTGATTVAAPTALAAPTAPGVVLGTVGYMSPEQAQGQPVDHRSDVFSFGCVLYEAATGRRAFAGDSVIDTLHRIVYNEPAPVTDYVRDAAPELRHLVRKCLVKSPDERYQSMREVVIDLRDLQRQLEPSVTAAAPATTRAGQERRPRGPARAVMGLGAVVLLLAASFAAWRFWPHDGSMAPAAPLKIERLTSTGTVIWAVVSPDAKYLAYVETGRQQGLWLRQVNGTRPVEIVPAAQVGYWGATFAPDSSSIYYAVKGDPPAGSYDGVLYRIPILGGTPRRLLTGIDSAVTMSPDGRQFAYYRADHPERGTSQLIVANADGSNPRAIASLRPPRFFAPGFFVAPAWSPDGARLAAGVRNSETRDAALSTFDVASGTEHVLPARYLSAAFTAWLPDGSGILFTATARGSIGLGLGGQIWLQPFPEGEPRRITSDLLEYRTLSVSADGASLVTVATETSSSLWMHALDRREPDRKVPSQRYEGMVGLSWLPDGRVLFSSLEGVNWQIWLIDADGGNRRQLTTEGSNAWPCATPDGRTIVFYSARQGQLGVWRMNTDGSNPRLLTPSVDASHISVTPDGRSVVFASQREGSTATWRLPIDGGTPTLVAPFLERVSVSPDGRAVAGLYRESPGAQLELAAVPLEGGAPLFRVGGPFASTGDVRWTRDGRGLMVVTNERTNVWLYSLSGGKPERVTDFADGNTFRFEASLDGRTLAVVRGQLARDAFRLTHFR